MEARTYMAFWACVINSSIWAQGSSENIWKCSIAFIWLAFAAAIFIVEMSKNKSATIVEGQ